MATKRASPVRNPAAADTSLRQLVAADAQLRAEFADRLEVNPRLTRQLVSFQANKERAGYRWFKYKEAFSAALVEHFLRRYEVSNGPVLDPFAGMGTTLFSASELGLEADGIELLPIGRELIETRLLLERALTPSDLTQLRRWRDRKPWEQAATSITLPTLRITAGAYPPDTAAAIERYLGASADEGPRVRAVLRLALLCVLESVSFTRKDGQYLRWDHRSGRRLGGKAFDKGRIWEFGPAVSAKLIEILDDTRRKPSADLFAEPPREAGEVRLFAGSCLDVLPTLPADHYEVIFTSPPYCNRYAYTRTYALELALLGVDEAGLTALRQQMVSCTVENRAKDLLAMNRAWERPVDVADRLELLQHVVTYLEAMRADDALNNPGIPRMVRGYFYEMACVVAESARVLRPGGRVVMVNDNVRYAGASVSVDLILSAMAEQLGLAVENIFVLPSGKGNSSQQMGEHGRDELRKCVYVWRKP